ncbi:hypothetical protein BC829DRAFT_438022 [Chytridium lagenaria]|nr:hypothetical protein BC829DRAFT_438022 [Chytridium lagenaria]
MTTTGSTPVPALVPSPNTMSQIHQHHPLPPHHTNGITPSPLDLLSSSRPRKTAPSSFGKIILFSAHCEALMRVLMPARVMDSSRRWRKGGYSTTGWESEGVAEIKLKSCEGLLDKWVNELTRMLYREAKEAAETFAMLTALKETNSLSECNRKPASIDGDRFKRSAIGK